MAKRLMVLMLVAAGLTLALQASAKRTTQGDLVYLQNGSDLRISIETYRTKGGWTPVTVSVAGAEIRAVMDEKGRVVRELDRGISKRGAALFTIELDHGRILLGGEAHAILVYEQNSVRTRLQLDGAIALPVRMDRTGKNGTLRFGGLEIPAQVAENGQPQRAQSGIRAAGPSSAPSISRGFGAPARLSPSRLRTSGK
jgi:hypothetical protein